MPFSGTGDGTSWATAYQVTTPAELIEFLNQEGGNTVNTYYKQMNDIDCTGVTLTSPLGNSFHNYDGQGYQLINMSRLNPSGSRDGLLCNNAQGGIYRNIILKNPYFEVGGNGGLLMNKNEGAFIENCSINGGEIVSDGGNVGTFLGHHDEIYDGSRTIPHKIINCRSTATLTHTATTTPSSVGGFVGIHGGYSAPIENSYYAGVMTISAPTGAFIGTFCGNEDAGTINCFFDSELGINERGDRSDATPKTTAEMQDINTYIDDINTVGLSTPYDMVLESNYTGTQTWKIKEFNTYPVLGFESFPTTFQPYRIDGVAIPGICVEYRAYSDKSTRAGEELIQRVFTDANGYAPLTNTVTAGKFLEVTATYTVPDPAPAGSGLTPGDTYADIPKWIAGFPS